MADSADERNLMIELTAEGQVRPSVRAAEHLAKLGGCLWRLVPETGQMMLLERVGASEGAPSSARHIRLAGTFEVSSDLHNALSMIAMGQQEGALHISNGDQLKVLYFRNGVLLGARSNLPEDRLGNVMVRVGLLTAADRDKCLPEVRAGQPLGTVLVAKGIMNTAQIYDGLRRQAEEVFFSVLSWPRGAFYLIGPLDQSEVPAMLHLNTTELLMDGVRRIDEEGAEDTQSGLRRVDPVSVKELPEGGVQLIVDTYNKAFTGLFEAVGKETAQRLRTSLTGFIQGSLPFHDLFFGVGIEADGRVSERALIDNVGEDRSEATIRNVQMGLSEILVFALFAAGEEVTPELQDSLQGRVAEQLRALPKLRREPEPGAPRSPTDFAETSKVDLTGLAAKSESRAHRVPAARAASPAAARPMPPMPPPRAARPASAPPAAPDPAESEAVPERVIELEEVDGLLVETSRSDAASLDEEPTNVVSPDGRAAQPGPSPSKDENSVIAAIVDEELSIEDELAEPVVEAGMDGADPIVLGAAGAAPHGDDGFELSLDQDEEIMSLLESVTEKTAEEAAQRSQAGVLPSLPREPRSPSAEFDSILSEGDDDDEQPPAADKSAQ